jgi:7-cyano-7-deazaguanine reductase
MAETDDLTVPGSKVDGPIDHVETFPAPEHCARVRFMTDEVVSVCPLTGQPDITSLVIDYAPRDRCVESKSLKHYLWSFRDKSVFAEELAGAIAAEIMRATSALGVRVVATQHARGGIVTECTSVLGTPPA